VDVLQKKIAEKQEELDEAEKAVSDPGEKEQALQAKIDELTAEANQQSQAKRALVDELKEESQPLKEVDRQLSQLKRQHQTASRNLAAAQKRLEEARAEMFKQAGSAQSKQAQMTAKLAKLEQEFNERHDKTNELRETVSAKLRSYEEIEPQVKDAESKVQNAMRRLDGAKTAVRNLQEESDEFALLGPRVRRVYNMVRECILRKG